MSVQSLERDNGAVPPSAGTELIATGRAVQQVRTQYATAVKVQQPREIPIVQRRLVEEARLSGQDFFYGWGVGDDRIEGPSVKCAVAAARCWGNCAIEIMPVQETPDSWIFTTAFIDLETGFTMDRQFRQSKHWRVYGKLDEERKTDVRFQIGQSKATRNVILNALPQGLIAKAIEAAKEGVRQKIEEYIAKKGMPAAIDMMLKVLAKLGVKEDRVLRKMGVAKKDGLDLDALVILRGDAHAIESGQEYASTLFPEAENGAKEKTESLKEKLAEKPAETPSTDAPQKPPAEPPEEAPGGRQTEAAALDQDSMGRQDKVDELRESIRAASGAGDFLKIGAELHKHKEWLGEAHAGLYAELVERSQAGGKAAPAKGKRDF